MNGFVGEFLILAGTFRATAGRRCRGDRRRPRRHLPAQGSAAHLLGPAPARGEPVPHRPLAARDRRRRRLRRSDALDRRRAERLPRPASRSVESPPGARRVEAIASRAPMTARRTQDRRSSPRADLVALLPEMTPRGRGLLILLLDAIAPRLRRLFTPLALAVTAPRLALVVAAPSGTTFGGLLETTPLTLLSVSSSAACATLARPRRQGLPASAPANNRRVLGAAALGAPRRLADAAGPRAADRLPRPRAALLLPLRPGRLPPPRRPPPRRPQVLPDGRLRRAFVLYGIALLYGAAGCSTDRGALSAAWPRARPSPSASCSCSSGFGFKMALVPFHAWAPDTYQGAPSPFVAFLSVAPKVASALVLFRLLADGLRDRPAATSSAP